MLYTNTACCYTRIKKWGITALIPTLLALPVQAQSQADFKQALKKKQQAIGQQKVSFTVKELEALGVQTIGESMDVLTKLVNPEADVDQQSASSKQVSGENGADVTAILSTLRLDDIDRIEISRDGEKIKYHVSRAISKDGVTATFSFSIIDERFKQSTLDPVVTTATKVPLRRSEVGDVIRVLEGKELETLGVTSVEEALALIGDASMSIGSNESIFFRGSHSGATNVLYNGIDLKNVSGTNGAPLFRLISLQEIDRIEVISGSSSTIQGSNSLGGVINIISKENDHSSFVQSQFGPDQVETSVRASKQIGNSNIYVLGSKRYNNQLSAKADNTERDPLDRQSLTLGITDQNLGIGKVSGFISKIDEKINFDEGADHAGVSKINNVLASMHYHLSVYPYSKTSLRWSFNQSDREYFNKGVKGRTYQGYLSQLDLNHFVCLKNQQTFLLGLNYGTEKASYSHPIYTMDNFNDKTMTHTGIYSQYRWINPLLSTQLGARYEHNNQLKDDHVSTYDISLFRQIPIMQSLLKITHKTGIRTPSLYEVANKKIGLDVEAEKSHTNEVSLEKKLNSAILYMTYFETKLTNKIAYDDGKYFNVKSSKQHGLVYGTELKNVGPLSFIKLSRSHITARDNQESEQSLQVPEIKTVLTTGVKKDKWTLGALFIHESKKRGYIGWNIGNIPSYHYIDLNLQYQFNKKLTIHSKVHNVLDESYQTVAGYNEPGRTLYLGAKYYF
ncbi:MAG: TonB-dependent receptor [bacterium]